MSLRINHNINSLHGQNALAKNDAMVSKSLARLSSGLRINRAADDSAGLVISEQMRAQITGLNTALSNSEQAVTMVQTAEGALDEVNGLLNKARSLALHSSNSGINDTNAVIADQAELDNIIDSVSRISDTTQFGTKKLLDGTLGNGVSNNSAVDSVKLGGDYTTLLSSSAATKGFHTLIITQAAAQAVNVLDISGGATNIFTGANLALASGSEVIQKAFSISINGATVNVASGTTKNQFVQQLNSLGSKIGFTANVTGAGGVGAVNLVAKDYGKSFAFDVQYVGGATGASALTQTITSGVDANGTLYLYTGAAGANGTANTGSATTITLTGSAGKGLTMSSGSGSTITLATSVGTGVVIVGAINGNSSGATFQVGANAGQTATVSLQSTNATQLGIGGSGTYTTLSQLKGSSLISGNSTEALKVIDKAIDDITGIRGQLGAFQANTLETGISSLRVAHENLTAAESTIRDVDFASESAAFTKSNILVQASTAMLAQANQLPQGVLKLLG